MTWSARDLFDEAMKLDPDERAILMRLLIDSLDADSEDGLDDVWIEEIAHQMDALDSGSAWDKLRARLYRR